jgi:undecaprenyl phosphate N,N'-diacetylbacillosamine 1-phosphate transferase
MFLKINLILKRLIDLFISIVLLFLLLPLFISISLFIKFDSKGPIFFKQKRITKSGKFFWIYKFRSMFVNADSMASNYYVFEKDPRITKVGSFLRKYSIDEIPQLINILKGDMSCVGPRPPVFDELGPFEKIHLKYKKRFDFNAGITGLAQINGRNNLDWIEKINYDIKYVNLFRRYGILIDIKILLLTVIYVIKHEAVNEIKPNHSNNLTNEQIAIQEKESLIKRIQGEQLNGSK